MIHEELGRIARETVTETAEFDQMIMAIQERETDPYKVVQRIMNQILNK